MKKIYYKKRGIRLLAAFALFLSMAMICKATTIGFVGAAGVNQNIPANYGSNANADGAGWTTSDGSGATPDVGLTWNGASSGWEFHNSTTFNPIEAETAGGMWDANLANAVAQLQEPQHLEINFSVTSGVRLILNSFDIGNATDQSEPAYGWNISLVKDSDSSTGWTHSTALFTAGDVEHVIANFKGDLGEDYTLNFDRSVGTVSYRSGIDNLSFSQDPMGNTTIIGFVGAAPLNQNIPSNYCSNVTVSGAGWISLGTPGIGLTWDSAGSDWEFHNSSTFTPIETNTVGGAWDANPNNAVAQMQGPEHLEIKFSVTSEVALVLNSFDIGNTTDQGEPAYGWNISLVKDSDSSTGWTHSTALFSAGNVETVTANFTGNSGEDYTLNFDRNPAGTPSYRSGIDNLSFSVTTVPKPHVITNVSTLSIGHRGASLFAPENTLAAFTACSNKSDMVEFDVRESSDGELVIMHDTTVDRTTDGTGTVASKTLAELKTLDAGSWYSSDFAGEKVPTLADTLTSIVPNRVPLIERKTGPASSYVQVLQNLNMTTSVVVQSFDWSFLDSVHAIDPSIELAALGSGTLNQSTINNLKARGINTIAWANGSITQTEVDMVHTNGMKLFVWTVNGVTIQNYINIVDGIISDDPGLVSDLADDSYSNYLQMEANIISYWMFNDGPVNTVATDSKGTNPGTLNGFDTPPSWTSSMNPQFDGALYLDGINDYVDIQNSASLNINTNSLSMSLWVKLPMKPSQMSGSYGGIYDSVGDAYVIYLDKANAQLRFKLTDVIGNAARPGIPEAYIETGTWHNIVAVFDGSAGPVAGRASIYWDGRLMDIHTGNDGGNTGLDGNVKPDQYAAIGRNGTGASGWQSLTVDDFAIWNRRLRSGEARQIFNSGTNGTPLSGLLVPEPAILGLLSFLCLMFLRRK